MNIQNQFADCGKEFSSPLWFNKHNQEYYKKNESNCNICERKFHIAYILKKHIGNVNTIEKCNVCDKGVERMSLQGTWKLTTGVCGGIYYEGIYMVKVILAEIYMLEHFLWSFFVTECHNYDQIAQGIQKFSKIWSSWLITKDIHVLHGLFRRSEWK